MAGHLANLSSKYGCTSFVGSPKPVVGLNQTTQHLNILPIINAPPAIKRSGLPLEMPKFNIAEAI